MTQVGKVGIWSSFHLWPGNQEFAAELEELGFGALWLGSSPGDDLKIVEDLLDATKTFTVATGIVNVWKDDAASIGAAFRRIDAKHPNRFLLGIGASHKLFNTQYEKPYDKLVSYLDGLDAAGVPESSRVLAALGPKVLELSAARSAGAHPYLTTPEHSETARRILGPDKLLAPELAVTLEPDLAEARATARVYLATYLQLPNYTNNFKRLGFTDDDFADGGSDRLVDTLIPHGADAALAKAAEHHEAGADHVNIQVITRDFTLSKDGIRALGAALPR
ncbi:LLM class F420-dependent oxidoreductase [Actinocrispum wychmicini]|uniref:Putative F420-dependent oxidoreductase n=1 Tax=Actinocrispum wychmicini TaxID=1213861 RepID=A0A4R2JYB3_9PSEU|nr:LLM class F420-dependent oxidoreductase [Actinocrispum wychmicini]TCO64864.1 putative F420-dependent oxidoreductase [Actinocrispum wychmicini]